MRTLDFTAIKDKLHIDKHRLDDELQDQAAIQHMISDCLNTVRESVDMLEDELERVEATIFLQTMNRAVEGKKPTLDYVKNTVRDSSVRKAKWLDLLEARAEHGRWEGLYYAWRSRNDALQALAKLAVANYFVVETVYERNRESSRSRYEEQKPRPIRRRETT